MNRILITPPSLNPPWYMTAHVEYLIRYLSDEFFMEQADIPYEPYKNFIDRFPETNPLQRNPDDYDLIWPVLPTHWNVPKDKYAHKVVTVHYEPGEGRWRDVAARGGATPITEKVFKDAGLSYHSLRFGIDTNLFKPFKMQREDNLLHVGFVGSHANPRRRIKEIFNKLFDIEGVRVMLFASPWVNNGGHIDEFGGKEFIKHVVTGNKAWPGIPNVYNQLDVLIRCDSSYGYSFPVLEAAACGVPVITLDMGIDHYVTNAGGGFLIEPEQGGLWRFENEDLLAEKIKEKVLWMRDNPKQRIEMGMCGLIEIQKNWTWEQHINNWREFFREGLKNAQL